MSTGTQLKWCEIEEAVLNAPLIEDSNIPDSIVGVIIENIWNWHWDETMTFGMKLSEDNCLASYADEIVKSPSGWQTTRGNLCLDSKKGYIYEWDIKAVDYDQSTGDLVFGILSDDGERATKPNDEYGPYGYVDKCDSWAYHSSNEYTKKAWTYQAESSRDFGGGGRKHKLLDKSFHKGDTITVIYDSQEKSLGFKMNGEDVKVYKDGSTVIYGKEEITGNAIYPFVTVYSRAAKAQLLAVRYYRK